MATTTRVLTAAVNGTVYTTNANGALEAIDTCHSGSSAPTNEVANGKLWLDTTTTPGILKMYNNAAWEEIGGSTSSPTFVDGTFTGDVNIGDDLFLTGPTPTIFLVDNDIADEYTQLVNAGGNTILGSRNGATNGQLIFRGEGGGVNTEYARFDAAGNFGIGDSTPAEKLDVVGNAIISGDVTIGDDLHLTGPNPKIFMNDSDAADQQTQIIQSAGKTFLRSRDGASDGAFIFEGYGGGSPTEYARFDANGNFGIGNSTPAAMLHVGSIDNNLGTTAGDEISLLTLQADVANNDLLQFTSERLTTGTSWTSAAHRIQRKVDSSFMGYMQFGNNTSDLITFGENATEYMRIDGSGNVDVTGEVTAASFAGDGSALTGIAADGVINFKVQTITSSTTVDIQAGVSAFIYAVGAGGSGGTATRRNSSAGGTAASGGAAGGSALKHLASSGSDRTLTLTVGAGGAGSSSGSDDVDNGNSGGTTSVTGTGISLSCTGGGAGSASRSTSSSSTRTAAGAAGGTGTGGDVNATGGSTGTIIKSSSSAGTNVGAGAIIEGGTTAGSSGVLATQNAQQYVPDSTTNLLPLFFTSSAVSSLGTYFRGGTSSVVSISSSEAQMGGGSGGATCMSSDSSTGGRVARSASGGTGFVQIIFMRDAANV